MRQKKVKVAIIGAGSAGLAAYDAAASHTQDLLLIDQSQGGPTCARSGCLPSKLLLAAAQAAHNLVQARQFGIGFTGVPQIEGKRVMLRLQEERARFAAQAAAAAAAIPLEQRLQGRAYFVGPQFLEVEGFGQIEAQAFVLATGSSPIIPAPYLALKQSLLTTEQVFDLADLPQSLAVIGSGAVGLELGQAFHRLGVKVTILSNDGRLGAFSDPAMQAEALQLFQQELDLDVTAEVSSIKEVDGWAEIAWNSPAKGPRVERFEKCLIAAGRRPNVKELNLRATGLVLDERGMPEVIDIYTGQCDERHFFIAGDANPMRSLLHEAVDEGRIAGENAARYPDIRERQRSTPLSIAFTDPGICLVGTRFEELAEGSWEQGEAGFETQGRARIQGKNRGRIRIYGQKGSHRILGAELVCPEAEHLGHLLAWAHQQGMRVEEMLHLPFYHPTVTEGIKTALLELRRKLKAGPQAGLGCFTHGVGG